MIIHNLQLVSWRSFSIFDSSSYKGGPVFLLLFFCCLSFCFFVDVGFWVFFLFSLA